MVKKETTLRVRYAETDQMGYVYYGNYAQYYEVGRVEALRELGFSYKDMEEKGIMLPVLELNINYKKPAFYDDEITIVTTIKEIPSVRITFDYECYNSNKELLNTGKVTLVFIDKKTNKPCQPPAWFSEAIAKFF
ncbi:MAG: acyl-CoA thioesterase [Bacteroidetes bacterium]|nr:acyl-CoA thioesterase [Bacteroidota bacterium]